MEEGCYISVYQVFDRPGREWSIRPYFLIVQIYLYGSAKRRTCLFCLCSYLMDGACGVATIEGLYGEVDFTVLLEQIVYYQFIGILTDLFSV